MAALREELAPLARRAGAVRAPTVKGGPVRGGLAGHELWLSVTGEGRRLAQRNLAVFLDRHPMDAIMGVGCAGALSPGLEPGAVIAARRVLQGGGGPALEPPPWRWRPGGQARGGTVVSVEEIVAKPESKARLWRRCGGADPMAVDLESHAWAAEAARRGLPWLVLRAVLDPAEERLPVDFERFREPGGPVRRGKVVLWTLLRPRVLPRLFGLRRRLSLCARRLAAAAEEALRW